MGGTRGLSPEQSERPRAHGDIGPPGVVGEESDMMEKGRAIPPDVQQAETPIPPPRPDDKLSTTSTAPALPPHMLQSTADSLASISNTPLFMTSLDPAAYQSNPGLEALQALAYEGPPWEIAQNFREQGNEYFQEKRWGDAREIYGKALEVLGEAGKKREKGGKNDGGKEEEEEEIRKERDIEEICLVNRAACNLELRNYRQTTQDCTLALSLNPHNLKAHYRLSLASFSLSHHPQALTQTTHALTLSPTNPALLTLQAKITTALHHESEKRKKQSAALAAQRAHKLKIQSTLNERGIITRNTGTKPLLPDPSAEIAFHPSSPPETAPLLTFPTLLLYPLSLQSDFLTALAESEPLLSRLHDILPPPWDKNTPPEYTPHSTCLYMETRTGGLLKLGKNIPIGKVLGTGSVEVVDGLVTVFVVPRSKAEAWVEEFREGKKGRK
ncbi:MAG: hypothetical protein M1840_001239 [Geoglossum simile]|nr:MAG: hypothetical protein M1840_001239 [Geoglossum simile]